MEKEGKIMSEEKKNLTDEERKELKEGLKKKIDEMSDDELDKVAGGGFIVNEGEISPYISDQKKPAAYSEDDIKNIMSIMSTGVCPKCNNKVSDKSYNIAVGHYVSGCKEYIDG